VRDDFAFVDELVPGIRWDAKYATWDNFTGKPVDGYGVNRIVGTTALCAALARASEAAASIGLGLLLWDGYRPQRATDCFVRWAQRPEDGRTKLRHYPNIDRADMFAGGYVAARSAHTRGSTIDLTAYDLSSGELAAMGGSFDLMDAVSHHDASGITPTEARNRRLLRALMEGCGFGAYPREWWHYTLEDEPYPDTYFDFPIVASSERAERVSRRARRPATRFRKSLEIRN
jgi:zinc D-Ala-D-Ala dipeptidase